jgi:hypothetical protein
MTDLLKGIKVKEVSVGFSFTKNLGNYQSAKLHFGANIDVPEGATPEQVTEMAEKAFGFCAASVAKQSKDIEARLR